MRAGCLCAAQDLLSRRFGQGNLGVEWDTPCPGSNSRARCAPEGDDMLQPRLRGYGQSRLELPSLVVDQILASDYAKLVARTKSVQRTLFHRSCPCTPGAISALSMG